MLLEGGDGLRGGLAVGHVGAGVPDDEIDLGLEVADEGYDLFGVVEAVVDAAEQDVLEGDVLAGAEGNGGDGFEEGGDGPFAGDGHNGLADHVVGGIEGQGEVGPDGFGSKALDAGEDAGGGDGHARFGDTHWAGKEADGGHEGVVVEEGFAHAHEDKVDAVLADGDPVAVKDGGDLSGDLAGGEVAADAEPGGEAELAVNGAAYLGGDADGGPAVRLRLSAA